MKKKTFVLMVARRSMKGLANKSEVGDFTFFNLKLCGTDLKGYKIHTIRSNYDYWKRVVDEVNAGRAVLSVRQWADKPYRSKQEEICKFEKLGIQRIAISFVRSNTLQQILISDDTCRSHTLVYDAEVSYNDGLRVDQFKAWFPKPFEGCIIHFTDFRY